MLHLLPYSYVKVNDRLRYMIDDGLIRCTGKGADKHYALLDAGREMLHASNSSRYPRCLFADNNTLLRAPVRAMATGDAAALLHLGEYTVHPTTKPALPAQTPIFEEEIERQLYQNMPHSSGSIRASPVNCYYTSVEIKRYFEGKNAAGLRYSRACGVLYTPDALLRVFHSRDVALEYKSTGENKLTSLLPRLFPGYLPPCREALLVLGAGFTAARKILAEEFEPERVRMARISGRTCLSTRNLGRPLYYLPVQPASLPLLRLLGYPGWLDSVSSFLAGQLYEEYTLRQDALYADGDDGTALFIGVPFDLTAFAGLIRLLQNRPQPVKLLCLDWQTAFYRELMDMYTGDASKQVQILSVTNDTVRDMDAQLSNYWGGDQDA
ncbi:hypothetical protein U6B65_04820 [Oscillospiraceae bacterium MB08-C2-2]|nr:hypothetical protein U6B65_04820 [Oscillospiraceae bacterium MB08-C2-2]